MKSESPLRLSVVIPAYNEAKLIDGTIAGLRKALRAAGLGDHAVEIIVCDNASDDDTAALAAALERLLCEPELASRLGRGGHERISTRFSFDRYLDQLESHLIGADCPALSQGCH